MHQQTNFSGDIGNKIELFFSSVFIHLSFKCIFNTIGFAEKNRLSAVSFHLTKF